MMRIPISCAELYLVPTYKMVAVFCLRVGTIRSSFSIISVEQKKNKTEKRILGWEQKAKKSSNSCHLLRMLKRTHLSHYWCSPKSTHQKFMCLTKWPRVFWYVMRIPDIWLFYLKSSIGLLVLVNKKIFICLVLNELNDMIHSIIMTLRVW